MAFPKTLGLNEGSSFQAVSIGEIPTGHPSSFDARFGYCVVEPSLHRCIRLQFNPMEKAMSFPMPAAYGMYPPSAALNDVVHTLNHAGFVNEGICMMLSPSHPIANMVREAGLHDYDRQTNSVAAKLIGWLSEFGAVMIPTVGFFIRSQAFFKALVSGEDATVEGVQVAAAVA